MNQGKGECDITSGRSRDPDLIRQIFFLWGVNPIDRLPLCCQWLVEMHALLLKFIDITINQMALTAEGCKQLVNSDIQASKWHSHFSPGSTIEFATRDLRRRLKLVLGPKSTSTQDSYVSTCTRNVSASFLLDDCGSLFLAKMRKS